MLWGKTPFSQRTEDFFNQAVWLHGHWFVQWIKKWTNGSAAVLHEPMAVKPARAARTGRAIWLYKWVLRHRNQVNSTEATTLSHAAEWHGKERSTRSCISGNRGYVSNRVHSLSILHSYCCGDAMGNKYNPAMPWGGMTDITGLEQ